jgi:hypothetical protein
MTAEERARIREAARCYVREQAPSPPNEVLERIAGIVLQARASNQPQPVLDESGEQDRRTRHLSADPLAYSG